MKFINVQQGTQEWLDLKKDHRGASEASMMMGASKYVTRRDLMHRLATGEIQQVDDATQKVFDHGHAVEAAARPIIEQDFEIDLFPAVALDDNDWLMASFDGITMDDSVAWECKQWNKDKAAKVRDGQVPDEDYWQLVHQSVVGGGSIEKILYTVTDGTREGTVSVWVSPDPDSCQHLISHWAEFERDVQNYTPASQESGQTKGAFQANLPELSARVSGELELSGNVKHYKEMLEETISRIPTAPDNDQDAADASEAVKWCKTVEESIKQAEKQVQAETATVTDLLDTLAGMRESVRQTRLKAEKGVEALKGERKQAIIDDAVANYDQWLGQFDMTLFERAGIEIPAQTQLFHNAMKGKKTLKGAQEAVDKALADMKVDTATFMGRASRNLQRMFDAGAENYMPDLKSWLDTDPEAFEAILDKRLRQTKENTETPEGRPSNQQIVDVLADAFEESPETVIQWLEDFEDPRQEQAA